MKKKRSKKKVFYIEEPSVAKRRILPIDLLIPENKKERVEKKMASSSSASQASVITPEEEASIIRDLAQIPWKYVYLQVPPGCNAAEGIRRFVVKFKLDPANKDCCFKVVVSDLEGVWVGRGSNSSVTQDIFSNNPHLDFTLEEGISVLQESLGTSKGPGGAASSSALIGLTSMSPARLVLSVQKKIDFYNFKIPVVCTALGAGLPGPQPDGSYKAQASFIHRHLIKPLLTMSGFLIGNISAGSFDLSLESFGPGEDNDQRVLSSDLFALAVKKVVEPGERNDSEGCGEGSGVDGIDDDLFCVGGGGGNDDCGYCGIGEDEESRYEKGKEKSNENRDDGDNSNSENEETSLKRKHEIEEKLKMQIHNRSPTKKKKKNAFL